MYDRAMMENGAAAPEPKRDPAIPTLVTVIIVVLGLAQLAAAWVFNANASTDQVALSNRLFSVSASIGGAVVWWVLFQRYAEKAVRNLYDSDREAMRMQLESELAVQRATLLEDMRRLWEEARGAMEIEEYPIEIYDGGQGSNLRLTKALTADIDRTDTYGFRGPTGVYVGARLALRAKRMPQRLRSVWVHIIDPSSEEALQAAVEDRRRRGDLAGMSDAQLKAAIRNDIALGLVGLFEARKASARVVVYHGGHTVHERVEILDDAMYVAEVVTEDRDHFPRARRWGAKQLGYREIKKYRGEPLHDGRTQVTFGPGTTRAVLEEHMASLGLGDFDLDELAKQYSAHYCANIERVVAAADGFEEFYAAA